ncbi:MAG: hypothetical protein R3B54_00835 [Bdellovibrionota bacterium]
MKKFFQTLFVISFISTQSALACRLSPVDTDAVLANMQDAVADVIDIHPGRIPAGGFTQVQTGFMRPLGSRCEGLHSAFHTSAYHFSFPMPRGECTFKGVAIMKGYGTDGEVIVHDDSDCDRRGIGTRLSPFSGTWVNPTAGLGDISRLEINIAGNGVTVWGGRDSTFARGLGLTLSPTENPNRKQARYDAGDRLIKLFVELDRAELRLSEETITGSPGRLASSLRTYVLRRR